MEIMRDHWTSVSNSICFSVIIHIIHEYTRDPLQEMPEQRTGMGLLLFVYGKNHLLKSKSNIFTWSSFSCRLFEKLEQVKSINTLAFFYGQNFHCPGTNYVVSVFVFALIYSFV